MDLRFSYEKTEVKPKLTRSRFIQASNKPLGLFLDVATNLVAIIRRVSTHIVDCYIANAKTKRNWLICGHVALDKCNVSLGQQVKNCCPATMH